MNVLLDTHVALWAIADSPKLPQRARDILLAPASRIHVSAASIWEISIKYSLRRGEMPISGKAALEYFGEAGYAILPVEPEHVIGVEDLPPHHGDPFDRLLVAQALAEPMRLVTHDASVARYSDSVILV